MAHQKSTMETVRELIELLRSYAKQETVDPLRQLGRFLGWGVAGAALLSFGLFFLALGALRAMQTETDAFAGVWMSLLPYVIVAVGLVGVLGLVGLGVMRSQGPSTEESGY